MPIDRPLLLLPAGSSDGEGSPILVTIEGPPPHPARLTPATDAEREAALALLLPLLPHYVVVGAINAARAKEGRRLIVEAPDKDEYSESEYWASVHGYADDLVAEYRGLDEDERGGFDLTERLDEVIDGSAWIIYNSAALRVMQYTDNDDAHVDSFGSEGLGEKLEEGGFYSLVCLLAYSAMRQDVMDYLSREYGSDPEDWIEEDEGAEEEEDGDRDNAADDAPRAEGEA